jgi:hypothetical protein
MENAGRLSFCGIKAVATMDLREYIERQSKPIFDELEEA